MLVESELRGLKNTNTPNGRHHTVTDTASHSPTSRQSRNTRRRQFATDVRGGRRARSGGAAEGAPAATATTASPCRRRRTPLHRHPYDRVTVGGRRSSRTRSPPLRAAQRCMGVRCRAVLSLSLTLFGACFVVVVMSVLVLGVFFVFVVIAGVRVCYGAEGRRGASWWRAPLTPWASPTPSCPRAWPSSPRAPSPPWARRRRATASRPSAGCRGPRRGAPRASARAA